MQGSLEEALAIALRCDRKLVTLVVAGRTDAGVHALHQVCHVDIPEGVKLGNLESLQKRVQGTLRTDDIALHQISLAPEGFEARFSALSREYEYRIDDRSSKRNPLHHLFTYRSPYALDDAAMNTLSRDLCGLHDWAPSREDVPSSELGETESKPSSWAMVSGSSPRPPPASAPPP